MTKFDVDLYFKEKLDDYFKTEVYEIISKLENSRDKTFSLEKIRDEINNKRIDLSKFEFQGQFLPDAIENILL